MPLVVFHTQKVRDALKAPVSFGIDLMLLAFVVAMIGALLMFGKQVSAPMTEKVEINLSFWALPKYTMFSLLRGIVAYVLSLLFTLVYGVIAAHNRRAEKVMIPALDVLQSIPVLSLLPVLVLAMIGLFPSRELSLEIACVVMIFTGQVWNMTFSFYGSIRSIPTPLREVAVIHRLGWWRVFRVLEVPASMIGLVWNSMMSMAGGWFFLATVEAFTLTVGGQNRDFRLPGIGSYMSEAITTKNIHAMIAAVVAMIVMIVVVDQVFWRPVVVWAERFKMEETADTDKAQSWVINMLQHSRISRWVLRQLHRKLHPAPVQDQAVELSAGQSTPVPSPVRPSIWKASSPWLIKGSQWAMVLVLAVGAILGTKSLIQLLMALPVRDQMTHGDWEHVFLGLLASFARTTAAVILGALWTLPAGVLIGLSPKWSQRLQPVVQVVASFPAPMLFPLMAVGMLAIHINFNIGCVALMLMGTQWYILFNVIAGAMAIPGELKEVGHVYRASRWHRWTRLYIPCVFPFLVTGMITAAGGAWNATIVAEAVQGFGGEPYTAFGLGSMIAQAAGQNFPLLAAATVTMAISVVILNRLFWRRLYRTAEERYALNV